MADNQRTYQVLAVREAPPEGERGPATYADLGRHAGDRAERAVEAAVDASGDAGIDRCVAIPVGNWTECVVEEDPRPRFRAKRVEAEAPAEPEPAE